MADSGIRHVVSAVPVPRTEFEDEEFHALVHGNVFPAGPVERQLFYRDDLHTLYIYNGTAWISSDVTTHAALTTGVHGVGANYLAYTKGSQKEALFHNNYMAYAWMSGDLATQNNVAIVLHLNTEVYDPGGNFNTATYRYTAPVAGYYQIIGGLSWDWSGMVADKPFYAKVNINAAPADLDVRHSAAVERLANRCVSFQHLAAGDYIELVALQISGVNTPILSGDDQSQCFMHVFLVQAD